MLIPASKAFVPVISGRLRKHNCKLFSYFTIFFKCQMAIVNVMLQSSVIISGLHNKCFWKPFYDVILQYNLLQQFLMFLYFFLVPIEQESSTILIYSLYKFDLPFIKRMRIRPNCGCGWGPTQVLKLHNNEF